MNKKVFFLFFFFLRVYSQSFEDCESYYKLATQCCGDNMSQIEKCLQDDPENKKGGLLRGENFIKAREIFNILESLNLAKKNSDMKALCVIAYRSQNLNVSTTLYAQTKCNGMRSKCHANCSNFVSSSNRDDKTKFIASEYSQICQGKTLEVPLARMLNQVTVMMGELAAIKKGCIDPLSQSQTSNFSQNFNLNTSMNCDDPINFSNPNCQKQFCSSSTDPRCKNDKNSITASSKNIYESGIQNGDKLSSLADELEEEPEINSTKKNPTGLARGQSSGGSGGLGGSAPSSGIEKSDYGGPKNESGQSESGFMSDLGATKGFSSSAGKWGGSSGDQGGGYTYAVGSRKNEGSASLGFKHLFKDQKKTSRSLVTPLSPSLKEIGHKHENLWNRMSERYIQICLVQGLWHCDKMMLKK